MRAILCVAALLLGSVRLVSQAGPEAPVSFDVASVKPSIPGDRSGRFITMQGAHQFVAKNHTLKTLVMAAYNVPATGVVGGPAWLDTDRYDITAATPGENRPTLEVNRLSPGRVELPARSATMAQFASMLQRSVLDRHVLDKTGLSGRYDFDLEWTPDETQFGGQLPPAPAADNATPDLFAALQQQLGLRLQASNGLVDVIVVNYAERP